MASRLPIESALPVGAIDTRASGWWAMIFVVFTESALFAYLLFSYFYLAVQPHAPGTFPEGGLPELTLAIPNTIVLLLSSAAVGWAQFNIERDDNRRLCAGLLVAAVLGMIFLVVQYFEWGGEAFRAGVVDLQLALFRRDGLPHGACRRRRADAVGALRLVGDGVFQPRALCAHPYRRALLAFRRRGVDRGVLHFLCHTLSRDADMNDVRHMPPLRRPREFGR